MYSYFITAVFILHYTPPPPLAVYFCLTSVLYFYLLLVQYFCSPRTIHQIMPGVLPPSMQLHLLSSSHSIFQSHCLKSSFISFPDFRSTQCKGLQLPEMHQDIIQSSLLLPNKKHEISSVLIMTPYDPQELEPILHRSNMKGEIIHIFFLLSSRVLKILSDI